MKTPTEIKRLGTDGIRIAWSTGTVHTISSRTLRENCPSAVSKAKRGDTSHDKPLTSRKSLLTIVETTLTEELTLENIWGIGNYALGMAWADGHHTGIYTYDFLYELGEKYGQRTL
jgi:ATP-binding protein involved in chromosome partitioning